MKLILILAFGSCLLTGNTQTPLIAHKSHSGSPASYLIVSSTNFGQIKIVPESWDQNTIQSKPTETFIPLNDSVILKRTTPARNSTFPPSFSDIKTDTLPNKNRYSVFEFREKYQDSVERAWTEQMDKLEKEKRDQLKQQQLESQKQLNEPAPAKKKKKSYLLFLFGITGGGMLLMKLFSGSKNSQRSIA